ncbi:MAG: ACT domain-containing protein [Actinomycetota bacterium]
MLEEILVSVDDRPGMLADIGELLGRSGVNIETFSAYSHDGRGLIHLVVDDGEDAAEILASNGIKVEGARRVLTATLDDRPGELGRYCRKLADAGVMISAAYLMERSGGETELIFAVDDFDKARRVEPHT